MYPQNPRFFQVLISFVVNFFQLVVTIRSQQSFTIVQLQFSVMDKPSWFCIFYNVYYQDFENKNPLPMYGRQRAWMDSMNPVQYSQFPFESCNDQRRILPNSITVQQSGSVLREISGCHVLRLILKQCNDGKNFLLFFKKMFANFNKQNWVYSIKHQIVA